MDKSECLDDLVLPRGVDTLVMAISNGAISADSIAKTHWKDKRVVEIVSQGSNHGREGGDDINVKQRLVGCPSLHCLAIIIVFLRDYPEILHVVQAQIRYRK